MRLLQPRDLLGEREGRPSHERIVPCAFPAHRSPGIVELGHFRADVVPSRHGDEDVDAVLRGLASGGVRYLIAGGLAVVAHGQVRFTKGIDLVLSLDGENTRRAIVVLKALGYRPDVAALRIEDFADATQRRLWVEEKGAKVLSLSSEDHRLTPIDILNARSTSWERSQ